MGKGFFGFFKKDIKDLLDCEAIFDLIDKSCASFSDNGENGTFNWTHDRFIGGFFSGTEGVGELFDV